MGIDNMLINCIKYLTAVTFTVKVNLVTEQFYFTIKLNGVSLLKS